MTLENLVIPANNTEHPVVLSELSDQRFVVAKNQVTMDSLSSLNLIFDLTINNYEDVICEVKEYYNEPLIASIKYSVFNDDNPILTTYIDDQKVEFSRVLRSWINELFDDHMDDSVVLKFGADWSLHNEHDLWSLYYCDDYSVVVEDAGLVYTIVIIIDNETLKLQQSGGIYEIK